MKVTDRLSSNESTEFNDWQILTVTVLQHNSFNKLRSIMHGHKKDDNKWVSAQIVRLSVFIKDGDLKNTWKEVVEVNMNNLKIKRKTSLFTVDKTDQRYWGEQ